MERQEEERVRVIREAEKAGKTVLGEVEDGFFFLDAFDQIRLFRWPPEKREETERVSWN
jgi:hypothetical protein